jgi:hypothetical protein
VARALHRLLQPFPSLAALLRRRFQFVVLRHAGFDRGLHYAKLLPHGDVVADALVGARDDTEADGLAFGVVAF